MARNTRNNTILIVDDNLDVLAHFWKIFEGIDSSEYDILATPPSEEKPRSRRRLHTRRLSDSFKFVDTFEEMSKCGVHYPLCIVDMEMQDENGKLDRLRGLHISQRVRAIDPRIHIVICTSYPYDGDEICAKIGSRAHFRYRPFDEDEFCDFVHSLVDHWNNEDN